MSSTIIPIKHVYYPIWITSYNQLDREYHGQGAQCLKLPQVRCKRIKGPLVDIIVKLAPCCPDVVNANARHLWTQPKKVIDT